MQEAIGIIYIFFLSYDVKSNEQNNKKIPYVVVLNEVKPKKTPIKQAKNGNSATNNHYEATAAYKVFLCVCFGLTWFGFAVVVVAAAASAALFPVG